MIRAIFPGTFDPIHYGHIDIARRASVIVDELIVAVYDKPLKNSLFTPEQRIELAKQTFIQDSRIMVAGYSGLTVQFCKQVNAQIIVRGLRVFSDFEYEFQMALMNRRQTRDIETVFLMSGFKWFYTSSNLIKEVARFGGTVKGLVPENVHARLMEKFANQNRATD